MAVHKAPEGQPALLASQCGAAGSAALDMSDSELCTPVEIHPISAWMCVDAGIDKSCTAILGGSLSVARGMTVE